ncbi:hypothetical protein [Ureaplasma diversum]|uniref:Uncharacterized protein n=2 Tax=Ureaplasma diversum TaxID=42094 RepID=A0A084F176_9BACT|nr:hypothetical protein [Ureaplasma diversum]KEZ23968.1 Hypothetical protein, predicted transmembrane protein [Ureaplasma diversum NCTC 246]
MEFSASKKNSFNNPFRINSRFRSSLLVKFLYTAFFVFTPMLIIFILLGEINALGLNGIVGSNAKWYGSGFSINSDQTVTFATNFYKWKPLDFTTLKAQTSSVDFQKIIEFSENFKHTNNQEFGVGPLSSYPVWVSMFVCLFASVLVAVILVLKVPKLRWDILTPIVSCWFGMFILIISGFVPSEVWGYLVRFVIIVIAFIIPIIIMVKITNSLMARSKHFADYTIDLYNEYKDSEQYYQQAAKSQLELKRKSNPKTKYKLEKEGKKK